MTLFAWVLAALSAVQIRAGGHAGHEHLAVVRVFSTEEELQLLNNSVPQWDMNGSIPCTTKSNMSEIDLILVYSKDLEMDKDAKGLVSEIEMSFHSKEFNWMNCFTNIKNMSAKLNPEQDVYDNRGYTTNKHWVSGPNAVFSKIMMAMMEGEFNDTYDIFFLMEMDAVPIKDHWLDQFETEAHEMADNSMAIRGSQYLGDKWDLFKAMMPTYLVEHINGNAMYNLKHPWTKAVYDAFNSMDGGNMMEEMAFDVAFAMITMDAMSGNTSQFAAAWAAAGGNSQTYNWDSMLVGNYANTLLNTSFEFPTYIRHGSSKNLFANLDDEHVTLGVAVFDHQGHLKDTIPTHHPFKKILALTYYPHPQMVDMYEAPAGNVTMTTQAATGDPFYHLCETARLVDTKWFALTDNYHIIKAPVSVLMDMGDKPVLPYVLRNSKYCGERPNCEASMLQAEGLFSITLNYHHDKYEVLYKTDDAKMFCDAWDLATGSTANESWANCSLSFGPTGDDYIAWKISVDQNITEEFTPKDKTRYGWRAWTSLWNPAPVDSRMCTPMLYGPKEYLETLGNISHCAVDYVENAAACESDTTCEWKAMFESGVCFQDPKSVTPTTTVAGVTYSTIEVTLPLTVDDAAAILNNATVQDAMKTGFAQAMDVPVSDVMLEIQAVRRLTAHTRKLQTELLAIFSVVMPSLEDAIVKQVEIETISLDATNEAIASAVASVGFSGALEVTGKMTMREPCGMSSMVQEGVTRIEMHQHALFANRIQRASLRLGLQDWFGTLASAMTLFALVLAALAAVQIRAGGHAGHEHLAVVRVFSTEEELQLLNNSVPQWDMAGSIPCTTKSNMSEIDLILVYSKDLEMDKDAKGLVSEIEMSFHSKEFNWMNCFTNIKNMSAKLNPEQDVYDNRGYTTNKHWVSGPNAVFSKIMMAMMEGEFNDTYDIFFLMEMDAVPIKDHWLDQFETEAHEMADNSMAIRGSQYLGDKWDLFKAMMPTYLVEHINGNAMYNLKHPWTKAVYDAFNSMDGGNMMEEMAFDVAFAMITMDAMSGNTSQFAAAWAAAGGNSQTYNWDSMLVGNYANTLLNTSFEFPTYIRHGSSKNLFANLDDEHVTLGVAVFDHQGHLKDTIPTHHPFKKILALTYYPHPQMVDMYEAPAGNVTMTTQAATGDPFYHLCETARLVDTKWFALTDNYHIIKAPVSVLMDMGDKPVLPYVLRNSKYCGERPNCEASMLQAEGLFSITLNYHHDKYEVLYKTDDAKMFCDAWDLATGSTANESWANCSLSFGPTGDDYIAWKISVDQNITEEFTPKDKTRYGWRAWTSLWNPAPVDSRMCTPMLYGPKEYLETLGNISHCAVDYVENAAACESDTTCEWKAMFESGVCFQDPKSVTPTTTVAGVTYSTIEVTLPLTVDDAAAILNNATVQDAMKTGFAQAMDVPVADVMLEIQAVRRLTAHTRKLQTELLAIFSVVMPSLEDAIVKQVEIETISLDATNEAIASAVASVGFSGALEVTGKMTMREPCGMSSMVQEGVTRDEIEMHQHALLANRLLMMLSGSRVNIPGFGTLASAMTLFALVLAALAAVQIRAGGHAGHEHLAVVRVFSTEEELQLLNNSVPQWDMAGSIPCTTKSNMSEIDLILVYSKDLEMDKDAKGLVSEIEMSFHSKEFNWMNCFTNIKNMSAKLNPEQDVYDNRGYTTNKHWVSGPNAVFSKIMMAMMEGEFNDTYDIFFLMEMDAVPIKDHWLDQFETEAHEMADNSMAIRGSQYLGDKWDLFKAMMPTYLVEHINGNAMYNLKHPWTKAVYDAFNSMDGGNMMEEMAFDVAFAMITMDAMSGNTSQFAAAWAAAGGNSQTYNWDSMLVGNYANTLLNTSFEFPTYIRHGSSKNLFANLDDEHVTLGVAVFDHQGHLKDTIPTHHPFKKILALTYYPHPQMVDMYEAPAGNVTMTTQAATGDPFYHLCETARLVDTKWFALTDNYHIIKAPVSVLMDMGDKPVLPYVLRNSKYCGERPNCEASMLQAEGLFSITLNYHHDKYEVLYKTDDAKMFCDAWDLATGSTANESWANCSLSFGPTGDDYIAWKISVDQNITEEFTPKDKTRYGWRAWTSLWNPAPVDSRMCTPMLYGPKEYLETLGNISHCAVDYVENAAACESDTTCEWKAMFESGVCFQDPKSVTPTTTVAGVTYSTIEVTLPLTVDDAAAILNNATVQDAMKTGFAQAMDVPVADVMLEIQAVRRLTAHTRKLQTELLAIFSVVMPSLEDAIVKQVEIETISLDATNEAIASAVASVGFSGALEVTGKMTMREPCGMSSMVQEGVTRIEMHQHALFANRIRRASLRLGLQDWFGTLASTMTLFALVLAALAAVQIRAGGHAGHEHLAVVRVFSTEEELQLLNNSVPQWDMAGSIPCTTKSNMSEIDLILVYSKDLEMDQDAKGLVSEIEMSFHSKEFNWMNCFTNIKNMSAKLNPEQDVYDNRGYTTNKHWVSGPNAVFSKIMMAMMEGEFNDTYDIFFLMEMDAVPIKDHWLDQFETEAHEMADNSMAIRGSQYLGDKWDLFKAMMPTYLVEHINGNAMYNLKHPWTKAVYDAFSSMDGGNMMEEMAFDVAFAMITMDAMSGNTSQFAAAWAAAGGNSQTYNWDSMLVGNYANTLLNTSFEFPTYIRHGSSKNLFANLDDEHVTLGVAVFDHQGHLKDTIPTHHPFKKILALTYYPHPQMVDMYEAPAGNVTMTTQAATGDPFYHLCETARLVDTKWFALTDNYHIIKAPVSVLMDMGDKPVLPYVLRNSKYCGERPNCEASMLQAEGLFSITLNYHHDKYEVLYKTDDAKMFCDAWDLATGSTANESWANCSLSFGPTGDDYIAWKISVDQNITEEFTPKDKTRYGWRAWTSLWNPAPVDSRMCTPMLYGPKEYLETLGNISHCAVDYVENAAACESDTTCEWKAMFESGVCFQDPKSVTPTTTVAGVTYSTIEVTLPLTVDDAAAILNNATVQDAMKTGFAQAMDVPVADVMLEIQAVRRLTAHTRKLQVELLAIFSVVMPSLEDAIVKQVEIETISLDATNEAIASAVASVGFSGALEVTGKMTMRVPEPTTTTTTTTTTTEASNTTTTEGGDDGDDGTGDDGDDGDDGDGDEEPPSSAIAGTASAAVLGSSVHPEDSSNPMEAGIFLVFPLILLWEFTYCDFFGENALYFIIGFSFAMNFVDNSLSRAVREELIQVPLSTACSVVLFIGTLGADDFVDFCEGFFLELLYGIAERLILGSLMEAGEKSVAQGIHWVKTRSWFWRLALIVTGGRSSAGLLMTEGKDDDEMAPEEMVMEGTPIEEAMEEVIGCGTTCMSTVMTPFIILAIFFFAEETEIPAQYDIRSTDLVCYLLFGLIIAPFQVMMDILMNHATELQNNVRIYDYMLYAKWRWRNRVTRWLFDDPRLDLSIAEPLQSVNHLAFSPQFYFIETYYTWGMLVSLLSITIFLRKSMNPLDDPALFIMVGQMILLNYILDRLIRWLISSVLWKPMDNSNFRIFSRSVALALQRKDAALLQEKYRQWFWQRHTGWLVSHLNDIFTPRSRERYKGKLSLLYQQALQLQPTRVYKTPGDAFPEPVGQQELPENLRLELEEDESDEEPAPHQDGHLALPGMAGRQDALGGPSQGALDDVPGGRRASTVMRTMALPSMLQLHTAASVEAPPPPPEVPQEAWPFRPLSDEQHDNPQAAGFGPLAAYSGVAWLRVARKRLRMKRQQEEAEAAERALNFAAQSPLGPTTPPAASAAAIRDRTGDDDSSSGGTEEEEALMLLEQQETPKNEDDASDIEFEPADTTRFPNLVSVQVPQAAREMILYWAKQARKRVIRKRTIRYQSSSEEESDDSFGEDSGDDAGDESPDLAD
ncbi:unnamed protein product [Symbiodinium sp. CCMP2592]|nr:unnamed protein product [Symbiodinium sp. CCMP2592]